jgi:hypothetical protein
MYFSEPFDRLRACSENTVGRDSAQHRGGSHSHGQKFSGRYLGLGMRVKVDSILRIVHWISFMAHLSDVQYAVDHHWPVECSSPEHILTVIKGSSAVHDDEDFRESLFLPSSFSAYKCR